MRTINVADATPTQLDWLVAKCEGTSVALSMGGYLAYARSAEIHPYSAKRYRPTTDWSQMGPIIEREGIALDAERRDGVLSAWYAVLPGADLDAPIYQECGPTPLIAAARCYVTSKLGDTVEAPEELT